MRHWFSPRKRRNSNTLRRPYRLTVESLEDRRLLAAPVINPIVVPLNIPANKSLIVPIATQDPALGAVNVTVTSSNPAVTVTKHTGNNFLLLNVQGFGQLEFELFGDVAPQTVSLISGLVKSGFYNGLTFHRIMPNFVIQGGDPAGTGTGNVGFSFSDEFNTNAIFSGSGQLAMANSGKDTNGSQFFVTVGTQRFLDFNHTIWGQLVRGFDVLNAIDSVPTDANSKPLTPVVITSAQIVQDNTDAVFTLNSTSATTGPVTLTITATGSTGEKTTQTVTANVVADATNDPAILGPVTDMVTPVGTALNFTLTGSDLENDPLSFEAILQGTSASNATVTVNGAQVTVTPNPGFKGSLQLLVGAKDQNATTRGSTSDPFDTQLIQIGVGDMALGAGTPTTVTATEGAAATNVKVGAFTDPDTTAVAGDFSVTINWGDGTPDDTTSAKVTGTNGSFTINGTHTYKAAGTFPVRVVVNDSKSAATTDSGGARLTMNTNATVADAALTAQGANFSATAGTASGAVTVATFTDADPNAQAGSFSATINWGDGTSSTGTVQAGSSGGFSVTGNHTYATAGSFAVVTNIVDVITAVDVPSASASAAGTATVTAPPVRTSAEAFVDRLFLDYTGRAATDADRAAYGGQINQGVSHVKVAEEILNSLEGMRFTVQKLFLQFLGRAPEQAALNNSVALLQTGGTIADLTSVLIGSDEYFQKKGGGTNNGFLTSLYQDVLGRAIEANALTKLGQDLTNGVSRQTMASWVQASNEGTANHEQAFYFQLLGRTPSVAEVNNLATLQQGGASDGALSGEIAGGTEFFGLPEEE